ncbi:MAG: hypothetical protein ACYDAZ_07585 [Thermoplasmataceae archaeon]
MHLLTGNPSGTILLQTRGGQEDRVTLYRPGYTVVAIIASVCGITYNQTLETLTAIREVVYSTGSHLNVECTRDRRELLKKLNVVLY